MRTELKANGRVCGVFAIHVLTILTLVVNELVMKFVPLGALEIGDCDFTAGFRKHQHFPQKSHQLLGGSSHLVSSK